LIDTNVVSEAGKKAPSKKVARFLDTKAHNDLYISVITLGELMKGIERAPVQEKTKLLKRYNVTREWYKGRIISVNENIMVCWGRLVGQHKRTLPLLDSLLAATCLERDMTLVTRNTKDFEDIPELKMCNPWL
jgi:predicted nucleic acid-binding protein